MYTINQQKVLQFMYNGQDITPLRFVERSSGYKFFPADLTLSSSVHVEELVHVILRYVLEFYSQDSLGKIQCGRGARRSALDIWRHAIFFRPEISIFDVMECLIGYNTRMTRRYCFDVERRVFRINDEPDLLLYDDEETDEFGLSVEDWVDIAKGAN